jgi:predicted hydrolase (HD superfamily)
MYSKIRHFSKAFFLKRKFFAIIYFYDHPNRQKYLEVVKAQIAKTFFKEPKFAAGTRREDIKKCELPKGLNIPLEKFIEICLEAMKVIASEIGL